MAKKILIVMLLALVLTGAFGLYTAIKYSRSEKKDTSVTKAPQTTITFPEGWDNKDVAAYLQEKGIATSTAFLAAQKSFNISDYPLLAQKPKNADLEGFIFPDTYFIPTNPAAGQDINKIIIQKALDNFEQKITPQMQKDAASGGMDLFEIITLASIIEKEGGGNQAEKKTIAGVFYNRLNIKMALESDATVNFATGKNSFQSSLNDTQTDSPYNTYKFRGLPPGPICNPGLNSILAAIYPEKNDYLYFLTNPKTGQAVFAKTYEEHLTNKQKYLR